MATKRIIEKPDLSDIEFCGTSGIVAKGVFDKTNEETQLEKKEHIMRYLAHKGLMEDCAKWCQKNP